MSRSYVQAGISVALSSSVVAVLASGCTLELVDTFIGASELADAETGELDSRGDADGADEGGDEHADEGVEPEPPLFDVGGDGDGVQVSSCQLAAEFPSHLGCEFFGIDVDGPGLFDYEPFGFVVINPLGEPVRVALERYSGRDWGLVDEAEIAGGEEYVFVPAHNQVLGTGIHTGATLRITSEQPIVVIQAHPAAGAAISSSATMLQPITAWASTTAVAGWRTHEGVGERAYLAVLARTPGTAVSLDPTFEIADAPATWVNHWIDLDDDGNHELMLPIEPGELLRLDATAIDAAEVDHGTSGSVVGSGQEHLTTAFSAHTCAAIPDYNGSCGHMQEQLSAALVGRRFVAPRMIASNNPSGGPDPDPLAPLVHERTMFQVVATEPDTEVVFSHHDGNQGVELETVIIDPEEPYAIYESARELSIVADKPIIAAAYMTNSELTHLGSPSMVQLAPIDQWTSHHWVWVPQGFETHLLVSASPNASVAVEWVSGLAGDDAPQLSPEQLDKGLTAAVAGQPWAVWRFAVEPGIYRIESSGPSSVIVAGWRSADGFAYLGGWGPSLADLGPEG
jgi:hypothetical protein